MKKHCDCTGQFRCIDSRRRKDHTYRRYRCDGCANTASTVEVVVEPGPGKNVLSRLYRSMFKLQLPSKTEMKSVITILEKIQTSLPHDP